MLKFIQRLFTADQWTTRTATIRDFELSYDLNDAPVEIT